MKNYPKETAERMATHLSTNETYSEYSLKGVTGYVR